MTLLQISLIEKGEFPENGFLLNEKNPQNSYPLKHNTNKKSFVHFMKVSCGFCIHN